MNQSGMHPTTAFHPSPVKDGRRILGDKPANACLSPARNRNVDSTITSPVKGPLFSSSPKKLLPSPSFAGQKRSIDQVDENRVNNGSLLVQRVESRNGVSPQVEEDNSQSTVKGDLEGSKQTHASMDSGVPTPSQQHPDQQTQQDDAPTTLQNTQLNPSTSNIPCEPQPTRAVPNDPETRKVFIQEKANLLRNRIQNAMRNVRDHQFDRRLSELEEHSRKYPRLSFPVTPSQPQHKTIARQATTTPPSGSTPRQLQPSPLIKRTSPSSESRSTSNKANEAPGLSSPPLSAGNASQGPQGQDTMRTPTQKSYHRRSVSGVTDLDSPMQLSSPPATVSQSDSGFVRIDIDREREREREAEDDDDMDRDDVESGLSATQSQKGDAVDGLLKLMNTVEKYGNRE